MDLGAIEGRLKDASASVRRVAILDLIRVSASGGAQAAPMLGAHLARENDEKSLLLIARHLGKHGDRASMAALARLRDDPRTGAAAAHAAILAHDRLERKIGESGAGTCPPPAADAAPGRGG